MTMNLTPLKYLLFAENGLTVFRNYLCLKRRTRIIVLCWVILTILNLVLNSLLNFRHNTEIHIHAQHIYYFSSTGFSIYVMIAALCYSKSFHRLLLNFDAFYKIFDDEIYNQRMLKAQKRLSFVILLFCFIKIIFFTYVRVYYSDKTMNLIVSALSQYNLSVADFRFVFQYFILSAIIFVASEQLDAIMRSIDGELSAMRENRGDVEHVHLSSVAVNNDKLNKWVKAYENIYDTSNLCNSMFSVQLTIMLLIVTVYYIILMYTITILTVEGVQTTPMLLMNLFSMIVFLMAVFVISRGGQKIQNSSKQLQQKLCKFCLHTLENEEYYKLMKDLLRYVRTRSVHVHVFGTLDVNMSMLPSVVALFTSYTVIALQFNNVL